MSIVLLNEKNLTLEIKSKVGESFTPNEDIKRIAEELESIKSARKTLNSRLSTLLSDCHNWNRQNDEDYEKSVLARMATLKKENQSEPLGNEQQT